MPVLAVELIAVTAAVSGGRVAVTTLWLVLALYGIVVQWFALRFARAAMRTAVPFRQDLGVYVMAKARLRANRVRMATTAGNAVIGVLALLGAFYFQEAPLTPIGLMVSFGFIGNEAALSTISTLEVLAHHRLRRTYRILRGQSG